MIYKALRVLAVTKRGAYAPFSISKILLTTKQIIANKVGYKLGYKLVNIAYNSFQ